jgi:tricorn protease
MSHCASRLGIVVGLAAATFTLIACAAGPTAPGSPSGARAPRAPSAAPALPRATAQGAPGAQAAQPGGELVTVGFPQYPSVSPDGSLIAFAWAGDLWVVGRDGGAATRLTAHAATESRSAWSPDGSMLAFESDRDGSTNIYTMELLGLNGGIIGGPVQRVTHIDRSQTLAGFTPDGEYLLLSGGLEPSLYRDSRMYRVPVGGGPIERITDAYGSSPSMAPDGTYLVFERNRAPEERPKYRGSGARDIWRMNLETERFERLTSFEGNDFAPHALPDGSVVYLSSRHDQNNIWRLRAGRTDGDGPQRLTNFAPGDKATIGHGVRDLAVSADGSTAVFCVWDALYTLDLGGRDAAPRPLVITAAQDADGRDFRRINLDREADEAAPSPDGKTIAVVARGEIFLRSTEDNRPTRRVTRSHARERDIAWSPDGRALYFASDESGEYSIYEATVTLAREDLKPKEEKEEEKPEEEPADEAEPEEPGDDEAAEPEEGAADDQAEQPEEEAEQPEQEKEEEKKEKIDYGKRWAESLRYEIAPVIATDALERRPRPSPDGRKLLFTRERGDLWLRDLATGEDRLLLESWNEPDVQWASDSRHIVYEVADLDFNSDIWLMDIEADGPAVNITRHPDLDTSPRLSADGKVLVFLSDRAGDNFDYDVYAVYLDRTLEGLPRYELDQHFKDAAAAAKKRKPLDPVDLTAEPKAAEPLKFDTDDAYLRIRRITNHPGSERNLELTPGGERIVYAGSVDGSTGLYSVDFRGEDRKTIQSGGVSDVRITLDGSKATFIRGGQASASPVGGGRTETWDISAPVTIDVAREQEQKFLEFARTMGRDFYHPTLKGLDWAALTEAYLQLAVKTRTPDEFNRVGNMMLGELDGSHTGIGGGAQIYSEPAPRVGYLGADLEPAEGGYRITAIIPDTPADHSELQVGDIITAVEGEPLSPGPGAGPALDFREAMIDTPGREILLDVDREGQTVYILITPTTYGADSGARYNHEVLQRAQKVDELSGGRLGYLHIRSMNMASVRDFERDLYAAAQGKDGLIIDVRDNGGGSTTDILLSSLTAPRHAYTIPRGADPEKVPDDAYPRDRRLIYGYSRPINVLMNQNSFSNAEIFSHSIKTTGRGSLVGWPTFGGVISTGSFSLIDGARVRRPFRGWYLPDGTDMENNGAVPDVAVEQTPSHEAGGEDPQLEAAVRELLARVG